MQFYRFSDLVEGGENDLRIEGEIASDTWWGDEATPAAFREELNRHPGDLTVYINSPGGDVFAASQIYTMLMEHKGNVTVKIDGVAASAASVIAMAGSTVEIAPTAYMMIHDPLTFAYGNEADMREAINVLKTVKDGLVNAYELKTGLPRAEIEKMMEKTTWMDAYEALNKGFVDGVIGVDTNDRGLIAASARPAYLEKGYLGKILKAFGAKSAADPEPAPAPTEESEEVKALRARLLSYKKP